MSAYGVEPARSRPIGALPSSAAMSRRTGRAHRTCEGWRRLVRRPSRDGLLAASTDWDACFFSGMRDRRTVKTMRTPHPEKQYRSIVPAIALSPDGRLVAWWLSGHVEVLDWQSGRKASVPQDLRLRLLAGRRRAGRRLERFDDRRLGHASSHGRGSPGTCRNAPTPVALRPAGA